VAFPPSGISTSIDDAGTLQIEGAISDTTKKIGAEESGEKMRPAKRNAASPWILIHRYNEKSEATECRGAGVAAKRMRGLG